MTTADRRMTQPAPPGYDVFRHEALLYAGLDDFVDRTVPFLADGVAAGEPVLVVVSAEKIERLRGELGGDARAVQFADMADVGQNPARIIPLWRDFLGRHGGADRPVRGIGEPIWAGRSPAELVECQRHEALLNTAFDGGSGWWLLCPYDVQALPDDVLDEARRSHRYVEQSGRHRASDAYRDGLEAHRPLPEPPGRPEELAFESGRLDAVRHFVARHARVAGLDPDRTADLLLATHEVATNTVRHGGGRGTVRAWLDGDVLLCEIRDAGYFDEPLAGRMRPSLDQEGGRGLWIINQLCDLVQVRSDPSGTVVRMHVAVR